MRRALVVLAFMAGLVGPIALMAQAPPPVPALPDSERRTEYTITGSNCNCPIGFNLYGDATDYGAWVEVYLDGVLQDPATYAVTSPSGSLATLPRPITDAILTFNQLTTGEIQIVGGRRPRRTQLFSENRGVAARDLNQIFNDVEAQNRETWDLRGRTIRGAPGTVMGQLPQASECANGFIQFDSTGQNPTCVNLATGDITTIVAGSVVNSMLANMPARTVKCNATGVSASPQDCEPDAVTPLISTFSNDLSGAVPAVGHTTALSTVFLRGDGAWVSTLSPSPPIMTILTSGANGIFTPSPGTLYMAIEMCGGGGGGGATGTGAIGTASPGSTTFFGTEATSSVTLYLEATGGKPGGKGTPGVPGFAWPNGGGHASQGDINLRGGQGSQPHSPGIGAGLGVGNGGDGAGSPFGAGGAGGVGAGGPSDGTPAEDFCAGGGGGGQSINAYPAGGGAAGGYLEKLIVQPISPSYVFQVGDGGSGGPQGTLGTAGASGHNGVLIIRMFFQ